MSEAAAAPSDLLPADHPRAGGWRELVKLAWPLVISSSFTTLQITVDRVMLAQLDRVGPDAVSAVMMTAMLFWIPFVLLQTATGFVTTFVAQYVGAGRPKRVGPAMWQGLYFALVAGVAFLGFLYAREPALRLLGAAGPLLEMEREYYDCLCFLALPGLILAAVSGFFLGRGKSGVVMALNGLGLVTNAALDYALIFGHFGFPEWGVTGAGVATVAGTWVPALVGLALALRHEADFAARSGWRFDPVLFGRLMRFGVPSGLQWMLDVSAFTAFMALIGWTGADQLAASSIAFTINMTAFIPMLGIGQAVTVLVGQRLGQDRPDVAERSTYAAARLVTAYMGTIALLYVLIPGVFIGLFAGNSAEAERFTLLEGLIRTILIFVAVYSLLDGLSLVFSFALRGAGDTTFVTLVSLTLSWPLMVLPTYLAYVYEWGLYWMWAFASLYIMTLALVFLMRFRTGKWKAMRVIEPEVIPGADQVPEAGLAGAAR